MSIVGWFRKQQEANRLDHERYVAREAAEDDVNPRCCCGHRLNVHPPGGGDCRGNSAGEYGRLYRCPCSTFIAKPKVTP